MFARSYSSFLFQILISKPMLGIASSPTVDLTPRDEGESIWGPLEQNILDSIGAFGSSLWDSVLGNDFSLPPSIIEVPAAVPTTVPELEKTPEEEVNGAQKKDPVSPPEPEWQTQPWESEECDDSPPVGAPDVVCDKKVGIKRIIFARDCGNRAENAVVAAVLAQTVEAGTEISTSIDDDCGEIFWTGKLTEKGVDYMRSKDGVLGVEDDLPVEFAGERATASAAQAQGGKSYHTAAGEREGRTKNEYERGSSGSSIKKNMATRPHKSQKRDGKIIVQSQATTSESLAFVSTAPGYKLSRNFFYYSAAGEGITVYIIDSGANPTHPEFRSGVIKRWIYAFDCGPPESDHHIDGHGSCIASKIAGVESGVAKKASLVIVKTMPDVSSSLDGLMKVINDLRKREMAGGKSFLPGYSVLTIAWRIKLPPGGGSLIQETLTRLTYKMIKSYGLVIVTAASKDPAPVPDFDFPDSLVDSLPIIEVGAADSKTGKTLPWSRGHPVSLPITAPGVVLCAGGAEGEDGLVEQKGSSFAAAAVAGLAAYFLSFDDVGPMLRKDPENVPNAVKEYILKTAYIRPGAKDRSIWNGVIYDGPD